MKKWLPIVIVALFAAWILAALAGKRDGTLHLREFGKLPVLLNGRIQPLDSVAINALLQIRERQTVLTADGKSLPALDWLAELTMKPEVADTRKVFRIDHPDLLALLHLDEHTMYYSFNDLRNGLMEIDTQTRRINSVDPQQRSTFEKAVMRLDNAIRIYQRLKYSLRPPDSADFVKDLAAFQAAIPPAMVAARAENSGGKPDTAALDRLAGFVDEYQFMDQMAYPLAIPPRDPAQDRTAWKNVGASLLETLKGAPLHPALPFYAAFTEAYRKGDAEGFNQAVAGYEQWLGTDFAPELAKTKREFFYNDFAPFYKAMIVYVTALLLACSALALFTWPNLAETLRRSAFALIVLAWLVHTFGLVFRMVLEGRPPVTNLYSSAIFIGWAAVIFGMALEKIFKLGVGNLIASFAGFVTLVIAHNLALNGDTMEMLRAVLDTNFWLATHVVVVTLGYAATFVAGIVGVVFVLLGVFTGRLDAKMRKSLGGMMYGVVCFATLFSFVGTILGGIWADQSWGRFWGWDPKENGALIIVIWNAVILHSRWGGLVRERGIANMTIFGNIVTSFSWFGVNMLGIGLHSYGFMDQAFKWLVAFIASQLVLIALGALPFEYWKSFARPAVKDEAARPQATV
jgi:ABC-type transport system involved in cytochrome c biogenesis permease subunit